MSSKFAVLLLLITFFLEYKERKKEKRKHKNDKTNSDGFNLDLKDMEKELLDKFKEVSKTKIPSPKDFTGVKRQVEEENIKEQIKTLDKENRKKRQDYIDKEELIKSREEADIKAKKMDKEASAKLNRDRIKKDLVTGLIFSEILNEPRAKRRR